jgi:hypothetical protein
MVAWRPKHVEDYDTIKCLWKWKCIKLVTLLWYIMIHGQQNIKFTVLHIYFSVYCYSDIISPCSAALVIRRGKGTKRGFIPAITKLFIDHFVTRFNLCLAVTTEVWISTCRFCERFVVVDKEVPVACFSRSNFVFLCQYLSVNASYSYIHFITDAVQT